MKKDYMKPTMRVVKLQYRNRLLVGSGGADGQDGTKKGVYRGGDDTLGDEDLDKIF